MKRIFVTILACVMLLAMSGCSLLLSPNPDDIRGEQTADKELSLGEVTGKKYENDFIGIGFTLPDDWTFYTDEQIKEMNNYVGDVAGQDYQDMLKNASIVYDMMATSSTLTDNVIVTLEKIPNVQLAVLDLNKTLENSFNAIKSSFENMGYQNITHKITTITIDGKNYTGMHISATLAGQTMNQTSFLIKCNGYLASMAVTTFATAGTDPLMANFYLLP